MASDDLAKQALLSAGIATGVLYVGTDMLAVSLYPGYSFASQTVSELFAIGAPTGGLVVPLFTLSSLALLAFAFGVWSVSTGRALRACAIMLAFNALDTLLLWNLFPMHMRGVAPTFTDTMHAILAVNPFVALSVIFGAIAVSGWFRLYSIATISIMLGMAVLSFQYLPAFIANEPTPWMGFAERASQYVNLLWEALLAVALLQSHGIKSHARVLPELSARAR
jgi:hypothetical protein